MSNLFDVLKVLPSDYSEYGGKIERWKEAKTNYPDCSNGCKYFVKVENSWGICAKRNSPRAGLLTWAHQAGFDCFEK